MRLVQNVVFAKNEPHAMHLHGPRNTFFYLYQNLVTSPRLGLQHFPTL